ncbi:MAG: hypothetical protein E7503_01705 [Ruminococcus sp.]|nr:hypothetical protein [Ruminococcus sp.]
MDCKLIISRRGTTTVELTQCISFSLIRDRYLPYSILRAKCIAQRNLYNYPCKAQFYLDGVLLHEGIIEQFSSELQDSTRFVTVVSKGYSAALLHNQPKPGIYTSATLDTLMTLYELPHVTYEQGVAESRYMYVKDQTSMWEMLRHYTFLLNGGTPYVTVPNHIRVTKKESPAQFTVPASKVIRKGECADLTRMVSRVDMADASGEYGVYSSTNPDAAACEITRIKQILLDRQYLSDPIKATEFRIRHSMEKMRSEYVEYLGYGGEDLGDIVTATGFAYGEVGRIELYGGQHGLRTVIHYYYDPFQ